MGQAVQKEQVLYLLDPVGASRRRPTTLRAFDALIRAGQLALRREGDAIELPFVLEFLHKKDGWLCCPLVS